MHIKTPGSDAIEKISVNICEDCYDLDPRDIYLMDAELKELRSAKQSMEKEIKHLSRSLTEELDNTNTTIIENEQLRKQVNENQQRRLTIWNRLEESEEEQNDLRAKLTIGEKKAKKLENKLQEQIDTNDAQSELLHEKTAQIDEYKQLATDYNERYAACNQQVLGLQTQLTENEKQHNQQLEENNGYKKLVAGYNERYATNMKEILLLKDQLTARDQQLLELQNQLTEHEKQHNQQLEEINEYKKLVAEHSSHNEQPAHTMQQFVPEKCIGTTPDKEASIDSIDQLITRLDDVKMTEQYHKIKQHGGKMYDLLLKQLGDLDDAFRYDTRALITKMFTEFVANIKQTLASLESAKQALLLCATNKTAQLTVETISCEIEVLSQMLDM
jgi:chromosome segregation ATPase